MPVNEDRPSLGQALAEMWTQRRTAELERREIAKDVETARRVADLDRYDMLDVVARDWVRRIEALLLANAAHVNEWEHDATSCPICKGEVQAP